MHVGTPRRVLEGEIRRDNSAAARGYANYDVTATGDIVAVEDVQPAVGDGTEGLFLVVNWVQELRRLVPN
jgi:hypothetical protein